jgi:alkane 1-monooxygenase
VLAHYGGDLERVNIHPRARKRVLARYGSAVATGASDGVAGGGVESTR